MEEFRAGIATNSSPSGCSPALDLTGRGSRRQEAPDQSFHCPDSGFAARLLDCCGRPVPGDWQAQTRRALKEGKIIGVKGVGGYHLACDAYNADAIDRLRKQKRRPDKPLAVMARDLECVRRRFQLGGPEMEVLLSPPSPILLLRFKDPKPSGSWSRVAPGLRRAGVMLSYTPLHQALFDRDLEFLVMTSGNLSGQPLVYRDEEALSRLRPMIDYLLVHDRPIEQPCDDSVVALDGSRVEFIRRSRGYSSQALSLPLPSNYHGIELLGAGADFKNTFCLYRDGEAVMSQHVGDLSSEEMAERYLSLVGDLQRRCRIFPAAVVCDLHPHYLTARALAGGEGDGPSPRQFLKVQHHHAHMASCMADNGLTGPVVGLIADGTGYGLDGNLWGCEVLVGDYLDFSREAHLEYVPLPGGESCIRYPRRTAISYLRQYGGASWVQTAQRLFPGCGAEIEIISRMLESGFNCPLSSGCGRLFDAVSAMLGICSVSSYDGQAAAALGALVDGATEKNDSGYRFTASGGLISPRQLLRCIIRDLEKKVPAEIIALRFHDALADIMAKAALEAALKYGLERVVLSGGVFQNQYLSRKCRGIMEGRGLKVYTHSQVPCSDAGIAFGQVAIGLWRLAHGGGKICA